MIEKYFIKNELNIKRWRRFKARKLAVSSLFLLLFFIFLSFTARFWASNEPLLLKFNGNFYFPVVSTYHPQEFGIADSLVIDYKDLKLSQDDFVLWPPIRWGPNETNNKIESYPGPPTRENIFGTDNRGRDVFSRLLYGLRYSFLYAFLVWGLSFVVAILLGGAMGYFGGKVDFIGQRLVEILSTVPQFFLLLIIVSIFEPTLGWLIFISSLFGWIPISYYVRGEFLKNRKKEFVEAAKSMGGSHFRILFTHILPNSLTPLITYTPFIIANNIVALAGLDYLGYGLTPPTPSWGELLNQAKEYFTVAWWLATYPSLCLFCSLTMLSLVGDGIRDAYDPHIH